MLELHVPGQEFWDDEKEEFTYGKDVVLQLEHSLVSISKWEAKHHKAFLSKRIKSQDEMDDYIRCMVINRNVDPSVFSRLTVENLQDINEYIENPMSATYLGNDKETGGPKDTITSELIYYWMITYNIPAEYQKWHINRLMALISVCSRKNSPGKKMSNRAILQKNAALNAKRRAMLGTKG